MSGGESIASPDLRVPCLVYGRWPAPGSRSAARFERLRDDLRPADVDRLLERLARGRDELAGDADRHDVARLDAGGERHGHAAALARLQRERRALGADGDLSGAAGAPHVLV